MVYLVTFLEGIITFISPCILPLLPLYLAYFAGGAEESTKDILKSAIGFICGFSVVFVALGAFAGSLGVLVSQHQTIVNIVSGVIVILFGLMFVFDLNFGVFSKNHHIESSFTPHGFFPALLFGIIFSISWTPCAGAFLSSALLLASQQGSILKGSLMLLAFSSGLGIPFLLSALLLDKLKSAFNFIKKHYSVITKISGVILIIIGFLMAFGKMTTIYALISS